MNMNYANGSMQEIFLNFSAYKLNDSIALWIRPDFSFSTDSLSEERRNDAFREKFSYLIPGGECFEDFKFDPLDSKILQAERYGGVGIGDNGGGVRCGNNAGYQVKGIGRNRLVGSGNNQLHSYGGLSAVDAIYETIYANLLESLLPAGVAKIYGVILTGPTGAYNLGVPQERSWGALMVRELALRPAHFLRAGGYLPGNDGQDPIMSDVGRVRNVNKRFAEKFSNPEDFQSYLGKFLMNCADQFAFSRMARLMHGSMGPSNICLDGRWIDLTLTQFLRSDENTAGFFPFIPSFYEEFQVPVTILSELISTYNKYNKVRIKKDALINYYFRTFDHALRRHTPYIFGVDHLGIDHASLLQELEQLKVVASSIVFSGSPVLNEWPITLQAADPMLTFIESVFRYIASQHVNTPNSDDMPSHSVAQTAASLTKILRSASVAGAISDGANFEELIVGIFIKAFKRSSLIEYYFKGRLEHQIKLALNNENPGRARELINDSIEIAHWAFSEIGMPLACIFQSNGMHISFDIRSGFFIFKDGGDHHPAECLSLKNLQKKFSEITPSRFVVHGMDFSNYLNRLMKTLVVMLAGGKND